MLTIQDVRKKYPQYDDMSDEQLANALHKKYYADMPKEEFYSKIGYANKTPEKSVLQRWNDSNTIAAINALGQGATNLAIGAGDVIRKPLQTLGHYIEPEAIPAYRPGAEGLMHGIGNVGGELAAYLLGAAPARAALTAAEKLPSVAGSLMQKINAEGWLPTIARNAAGGELFSQVVNPGEAPVGLGAILGGTAGALGKGIEAIRPEKYAQNFINDILKTASKEKKASTQKYNEVMGAVGQIPIVGVKPSLKLLNDKRISLRVKDIAEQFRENPTIKNAHLLQSQLGTEARELNPKGPYGKQLIEKYKRTQDILKKSIIDKLSKENPEALELYHKAGEHYKTTHLPYDLLQKALNEKVEKGAPELMQVFKKLHKKGPKVLNELEQEVPIIPEELIAQMEELGKRQSRAQLAKLLGNKTAVGAGFGLGIEAPHIFNLLKGSY